MRGPIGYGTSSERPIAPNPRPSSPPTAPGEGATARASFEDLYREHHARLHRFCLGMTNRDSMAEDIVQETLLRAYLHRDRLDPARPAWPWLKKVATRLVYDYTRSRAEVVAEVPVHSPGADVAEDVGNRQLVDQMLAVLPRRQRAAVTLRYLDDWKAAEIAVVLDIPRPAVEQLLIRARRSLRTEYRRLSADRLRLALWPLLAWGSRLRDRAVRGAATVGDLCGPPVAAAGESMAALVVAGAVAVAAGYLSPPATAVSRTIASGGAVVGAAEPWTGAVAAAAQRSTQPPAESLPPRAAMRGRASRTDSAAHARNADVVIQDSTTVGGGAATSRTSTVVRRDEDEAHYSNEVVVDGEDDPLAVGGAGAHVDCDAGTVGAAMCDAHDTVVGAAPPLP